MAAIFSRCRGFSLVSLSRAARPAPPLATNFSFFLALLAHTFLFVALAWAAEALVACSRKPSQDEGGRRVDKSSSSEAHLDWACSHGVVQDGAPHDKSGGEGDQTRGARRGLTAPELNRTARCARNTGVMRVSNANRCPPSQVCTHRERCPPCHPPGSWILSQFRVGWRARWGGDWQLARQDGEPSSLFCLVLLSGLHWENRLVLDDERGARRAPRAQDDGIARTTMPSLLGEEGLWRCLAPRTKFVRL